METIEKTTHSMTESKVSFFNTSATRQANGVWDFTKETSNRFGGKTIEEFYENFKVKISSLTPERLSETKRILCNEAYATALYAKGVITNDMISSIGEKVGGSGRGMTPLIVIENCNVLLGMTRATVIIFIVTLNSYDSFVLIDGNNTDM